MGYASNAKIVRVLKMLKNIIVDNDNIIIDYDSNFSINDLDNKSLKDEKKNESTNTEIIIKKQNFNELYNLYIRSKYI